MTFIHEQEMGDVRAAEHDRACVASSRYVPTGRAHNALRRLKSVGVDVLAERIAHDHQVDLMEVLDDGRTKRVSRARQHLAAVLRWSSDWSYPEVGNVLGLDHTSIMHAEIEYGARLEELNGRPGDWMKMSARKRNKRVNAPRER